MQLSRLKELFEKYKVIAGILAATGITTSALSGAAVYLADHPKVLIYIVREYCKVDTDKRIALRKAINQELNPLHAEIYCGADLESGDKYLESQFKTEH